MMKRAILAAALLAAATATASAEIVFVGTIKITAVSPQCQNINVNDINQSSFHPRVAGNANFSGISWVSNHSARGHGLNGLAFDATFRTVVTGGVGWGDPYEVDAARRAQIRVLSYTPALANITNTTPTLTILGQVRRLFEDPGGLACIATFVGTYVKDSNQ